MPSSEVEPCGGTDACCWCRCGPDRPWDFFGEALNHQVSSLRAGHGKEGSRLKFMIIPTSDCGMLVWRSLGCRARGYVKICLISIVEAETGWNCGHSSKSRVPDQLHARLVRIIFHQVEEFVRRADESDAPVARIHDALDPALGNEF